MFGLKHINVGNSQDGVCLFVFNCALVVLSSLLLYNLDQLAFGMFNDGGIDVEDVLGDVR